jgi:colanic acid biosynthesis glycosyl transferase WcaI
MRRLLHLMSFALSSLPALALHVLWRPALVLCIAPAFFSAPFAWLAARLSGARAWLHVQDFELDAATGLGLLPAGHPLTRAAAAVEGWWIRRFDRVSTISNRMLARLRQKGARSDRSGLFLNWVDLGSVHPLEGGAGTLKKDFGLPPEGIVALYAGSMGNKQGLEVLVQAAQLSRGRADILYVLCGEGSARAGLEAAARSLPNVRWLPLQPPDRLNALLNAADIHVLPQRAGAADLVMPSKLPAMLASGRAVIATAEPETEVGQAVGEAGVLVPPGDAAALCEAIVRLADAPALRARLGSRGRALAAETWSAERVLGGFGAQVQALAGNTPVVE